MLFSFRFSSGILFQPAAVAASLLVDAVYGHELALTRGMNLKI